MTTRTRVTPNTVDFGMLNYVDVQLTDAQILTLNSVPVEIISAPGVNFGILIDHVYGVLDVSNGVYSNGANQLTFREDDEWVSGLGTLDALAVNPLIYRPSGGENDGVLTRENMPVLFKLANANPTGGGAGNTMSLRVWYAVLPTVPFS